MDVHGAGDLPSASWAAGGRDRHRLRPRHRLGTTRPTRPVLTGETVYDDNPYGPQPTPCTRASSPTGRRCCSAKRCDRRPVRLIHGQGDADVRGRSACSSLVTFGRYAGHAGKGQRSPLVARANIPCCVHSERFRKYRMIASALALLLIRVGPNPPRAPSPAFPKSCATDPCATGGHSAQPRDLGGKLAKCDAGD